MRAHGEEEGRIVDAEGEELLRRHLDSYPEATQRELREKLLEERGIEVDRNAFARWARKKELTTGFKGLRAFTPAQVRRAVSDEASPLDDAERAYLAARKGLGAEPLDQNEAARSAQLPTHIRVRRFERIAVERLRGYFAGDAPTRPRDPVRRGGPVGEKGPPLGVSATAVAKAMEKARAAGARLTERQVRVVRAIWGVEGAAQMRAVDLAVEMGVHRSTVRDVGLRALASLRRAGHLSDPNAPLTDRRAPNMPSAWAGLLDEDLAAIVEASLCEDGPLVGVARGLAGAEILRLAYGLGRPAHLPRPLQREVAAELGFTSVVRFRRAYAKAVEGLLRVNGLDGVGAVEASSQLEEKVAGRLRRALRGEKGTVPADDPLPIGSPRSPNPLAGLSRRAVALALAEPYGLLSRRERYVLGLRGGVASACKGAGVPKTQGEVAEILGIGQSALGRFERRATEKLKRLLGALDGGPSGAAARGPSERAEDGSAA